MARLIDADALLKRKGCVYDSEGHVLFAVGTGDIVHAPTIDAIPVEWLRGLMIIYANIKTPEYASYAYCLNNVIKGWQKEQEAR